MTSRGDEIGIRILGGADRGELTRLAELDSAAVPGGRVLGAALDGRLVAAISLSDRSVVANPFVPTAELLALLRRRADQLGGCQRDLGRLRRFFYADSSSRVAT